ncbi:hypothetical protein GCM10012280_42300 [Wenjunlia tyrosinilytica]|uniref:Uncharacterized protein n=1 Tax=Wenjunlia tyrosinilytica TaxID=1544741 RepID=A0A918DYJ6_9ACTN|nr:hypothetical protein GCM10012280_42300 [Wenjunlia tyrosinilytica]
MLGCALATLLAALLVCSGSLAPRGGVHHRSLPMKAHAAAPAAVKVRPHDVDAKADRTAPTAHVCSAAGDGTGHSGCDGSSEQNAGATLPGPLPQPAPAVPPRLPIAVALPAPGPAGPLPGSDLSPDLHRLQVLRT